MKILLDGDEVNIRVGDWVSTSTGLFGEVIKIDELSDTVLVGKEKAFGNWIDIGTITGLESDGGYSSTFNRMVDEYKPFHRKDGKVDQSVKEYERYLESKYYDDIDPNIFGPAKLDDTTLPNMQDDFNKQHKILLAEKASKEHSKNGIDKPQLSLIPQHALIEVAKVFMYGAKKYDEYNYSKGEKNTVYTDACMRHINQYLLGKDNDDESKLLHLAHAVANLMMVIDNTIIGTNIENRNGAYKV